MEKSRQVLLAELQSLLRWKKSNAFYAEKLGITEKEIEELRKELNSDDVQHVDLEETDETSKKITRDRIDVSAYWDHEPSPKEIMDKHNIDSNKWKLDQFWSSGKPKGTLISARFSPVDSSDLEFITKEFTEFLKDYQPAEVVENNAPNLKQEGCLILNKQDAHLDKLDIYGNNDIQTRFKTIEDATVKILNQASLYHKLDKCIYILGSDQFNSEWTHMTTKGTPQQNCVSYHEGFELICNHEVSIITALLRKVDNLEVVFIPGNHDEYVGWHLVNWLATYFKNNPNTSFDKSPLNRKYIRYSNSALMFNHGDALKPRDLAHKFPIEFKNEWSNCDFYTIFTGDKHHEVSMDFHGIKFYQIPSLSNAKSKWDDKNGHTCSKAEMTAFLISKHNGMSNIYKEVL